MFTFISTYKKEEFLRFNKDVDIIYRNYQKNYNKNEILKIKKICKKQKRKLFLANEPKLAANLNLDGVYIPAFNKNFFKNKYVFKKNFLILGSAHNIIEVKKKEKQGVEIIFLSPIFKTKHYKRGLNVCRFNIISNISDKKIIALGGISKKNFSKLKITNAYGFSGISYFKKKL